MSNYFFKSRLKMCFLTETENSKTYRHQQLEPSCGTSWKIKSESECYVINDYLTGTEGSLTVTSIHAGDPSVLHPAGLQPVQRGGGAQWLPGDHQLHQPAAGGGQPHGAGGGQQQRRGHGSQSPQPTVARSRTSTLMCFILMLRFV